MSHDPIATHLESSLAALQRVAFTNAATSEVLTLYSRALIQDGQIEAAERTLQQATERYPIDPESLLLYATVAERQNHVDAAQQALVSYTSLVGDDDAFVSRASRIAALALSSTASRERCRRRKHSTICWRDAASASTASF